MNIEFTVEDYFNELQVMEKYYGYEEELYPWIYMLLHMAEIRKKTILKERCHKSYIIDLHKALNVKGNYVLKNHMKDGVPDFVIINTSTPAPFLCGCVEIKKIEPNETLGLQDGNFSIDTIKYCFETSSTKKLNVPSNSENSEIPYTLETYDCESLLSKIKTDILAEKFPGRDLDKILQCSWNYSRNGSDPKRTIYHIDIKLPSTIAIAASKISLEPETPISLPNEKANAKITSTLKITEEQLTVSSWNGNVKDDTQLVRHLKNFKKLLYTNGLEFYFLTISENRTLINVKKIADLSSAYQSYCDYYQKHIPFEAMSPADRLSAAYEWDRLIAGLTAIDWHQKPITDIKID